MRKKYLKVLCAGLLLASTAAVTSCSKDDGEEPGTEQHDAQLGYKYVEPCLQWNATKSEVATYMATLPGWYLTEGNNAKVEIWAIDKPSTSITYLYNIGMGITGLYSVSVMYYGYDINDLKSKVEKAYGCQTEAKVGTSEGYKAENIVINGRRTNIDIDVYDGNTPTLPKYMTVRYMLSL